MKAIKVIGFDADDTLWSNACFFQDVERKFCDLLADFQPKENLAKELYQTELNNMEWYGYGAMAFTLSLIETAIRVSQGQVSASIIAELLEAGKSILDKQALQGWGSKIIDRMAQDLTAFFPGVSGFSIRNLKYMRKLAEVYPDSQFVQAVLAQIPWWHNLLLLERLKDREVRN